MARQALPIPRCSERRGLPKGTPSRKRRCFRACGYWGISVLPASSPLRPLRLPRFLLLSGSESTAEDAEDAEEKPECEGATHYHPTTRLRGTFVFGIGYTIGQRRDAGIRCGCFAGSDKTAT